LLKAFKVRNPGAACTIQDGGRPGMRRYGIPVSGAMDQFSYRIGNLLVGNCETDASLEITLMGLELEAMMPVAIAVTGAHLAAHINGDPAPLWCVINLDKGDWVSFKGCIKGSRAYVAVRGGIAADAVYGSRSTFLRGGIGKPLKKGGVISVASDDTAGPALRRALSPELRPSFDGPQVIRVMRGPQADRFTAKGMKTFFGSTYQLTPHSDRQGLRTAGPAIKFADGGDIISDPTPLGAVQVPSDGQPIILHRDGQVTGGYPKIGIVASVDLDRLARLAPGDEMRFKEITAEDARELVIESRKTMTMLRAALGG